MLIRRMRQLFRSRSKSIVLTIHKSRLLQTFRVGISATEVEVMRGGFMSWQGPDHNRPGEVSSGDVSAFPTRIPARRTLLMMLQIMLTVFSWPATGFSFTARDLDDVLVYRSISMLAYLPRKETGVAQMDFQNDSVLLYCCDQV